MCVLTRVSGISTYHVQPVHSARYSVYGRSHSHSRRTRVASGLVQALRSVQSRLAAPRIHQVGCPSTDDERATTALSMLQRSAAAAQQGRSAAPLRRRTERSHHADQPCAAGRWEQPLEAARQLAAPRRCAAAAWRPWLDGADVHSAESTFTAAILQRVRVFGRAKEHRVVFEVAHAPASTAESQLCAIASNSNPLQTRVITCLLYTSPSPRDQRGSRMPSSA